MEGYNLPAGNKGQVVLGCAIASIILVIILIFLCIAIVGPGERGVRVRAGNVQEQDILDEGLHLKFPIIESVKRLSIRVQRNDINAEAASKDLQIVTADVAVNWHIESKNVGNIYQEVGDEKAILDRVLTPAVQEVVKAATAQLTAEEIITKRPELKASIDEKLAARLNDYGIILDDVSLVNFGFSPEFDTAIEAKQVAEQKAKQAVYEAQKAENDATAKINTARGEAEAQRLLRANLTDAILRKQAIDKWNGVLPTYWTGEVLPFVNIGNK